MGRKRIPWLVTRLVTSTLGRQTPWYLSGGVPAANCLAAYQAIGAASLAASYVNLANPGTYDLTAPVAAPTFDTAIGWTFDGATQYTDTGINPAANATQYWSIIVRFSGVTGVTGFMIGSSNGGGAYFTLAPWRATPIHRVYNSGAVTVNGSLASGVMCMAGLNGFVDGVIMVGSPAVWANFDAPSMYLGCCNNLGASLFFGGNIQAAAIYDTVLSAAQVLAISNAMAALPFEVTYPAYPGPTPAEVGEFMVVYFSDPHTGSATQGVTTGEIETMLAYLKNHATRLGIQAIIFGGDMTDSIDSNAVNQAAFMSAVANLGDIPHLMAIGNHDYSIGSERLATVWNANIPQAYYTGKSWWSGGFYEVGHSENAYMLLTIGAVDYIFLSLEFFPRDAVLVWADGLLTTYAARKAIIITHAYEYNDGSVYTAGDLFGPDVYTDITDADYNWGDEMWATIKTHDNVILIYSGHTTPPAKHAANSDGGQPVNQALFNYQTTPANVTMMRFMIFNPITETIKVETFSPATLGKLIDASNQFTLTY